MKFEIATIDSLHGLHSYMNTMLYSNEDLIRYQLRKMSCYWGYQEGAFVYYMLSPPWNKFFVNDSIN